MQPKTNVLVSGGSGSLGKALIAKLITQDISRLVVFSRDEMKHDAMRHTWPNTDDSPIRYFIGDVRDEDRLRLAFKDIDVVIHAAAMKIVPSIEYNPFEAVQTNIIGAKNVISAALACGVKKVIAVSTDKAVAPYNLYGATKMVAERLFIQANSYTGRHGTKFSCVRYGNVVNSRGSVIPLWREQAKTHILTLTDHEMTRYMITLPQASEFVLSSLAMMHGGEVFIPKIPSMKMVDLACLIGGKDANIKITGIRPGEKLAEALVSREESPRTVDIGDRYVVLPEFPWWSQDTYKSGTPMPRGWSYRSDTNDWFLTAEEALAMIGES